MATSRTVQILYCTHCHALCLEYDQNVARYGMVTNMLDEHGYVEETNFDWRDSESFEQCCRECNEELNDALSVDFDLFLKIRQRVVEDGASNFSVKIELTEEYSSYEEIPSEIVREKIFEGLL